jgi:NAD(P)H-dependent FMN reductase
MMPRILAFASGTRRESFNKKPVASAAQGAREAGAEVTFIDLKDFTLPLFDLDLEAAQGMPENGKKLKNLFIDHDGLLIASPEYNSSFPAILKNAIDWVSRPAPGEPSLVAFRGKVATLMSASPGALGALLTPFWYIHYRFVHACLYPRAHRKRYDRKARNPGRPRPGAAGSGGSGDRQYGGHHH